MAPLQFLLGKRFYSTVIIKLGLVVLSILVESCGLFKQADNFPLPKDKCAISIDWKGIVPGKSTRQDVIKALGDPQEKGKVNFGDSLISFYAYKVDQGIVADYTKDKVFFRSDGVVDWIEVIVADRYGAYQNLFETVEQLGSTLDVAYLNNNYNPLNKLQIDVLAGPDQLYVWSECGVVLDTLPNCSSLELNNIGSATDGRLNNTKLSFRFSNPYHMGGEPEPDVRNVVLMRFLFPPTTFETFSNSYMYKVPFGLWDSYVKELSCYKN